MKNEVMMNEVMKDEVTKNQVMKNQVMENSSYEERSCEEWSYEEWSYKERGSSDDRPSTLAETRMGSIQNRLMRLRPCKRTEITIGTKIAVEKVISNAVSQ